MSERRKLVEGLKPPQPPVDPQKENAFVYGEKATAEEARRQSALVHLPRAPKHPDSRRLCRRVEAMLPRTAVAEDRAEYAARHFGAGHRAVA